MGSEIEFPPEQDRALRRARTLEWITIAYLASAIVLVAMVMGNSQAMKTVWFEDLLSLVPPISFLVASKIAPRGANADFPYGYHRVVSIAYLCGSLALLGFGLFLLGDAAKALISQEHPSIGTIQLFGQRMWLGWPMMAVALYSAIPAMILGLLKLPVARTLHDKSLYADAKMNKADWLSGVAASLGIIGIATGLWWADAVAAAVISTDIVRDGWSNLGNAVTDLMDRHPRTIDTGERDPIVARVESLLRDLDWVEDVRVRLREEGHVFVGEAFVVPRGEGGLLERCNDALAAVQALDWRLHDVLLVPVTALDDREASRG